MISPKETLLLKHRILWQGAFVWSRDDCFMSVFSYCNDFPHITVDLGARWRGTYSDQAGAAQVLKREGGGLAGMTKEMERAGIPTTLKPERGDPVCVTVDGHQIGGIYLGDFTMLRLADRGHVDVRVKHMRAWRI